MPKAMCIAGMIVAILIVLLFGMDVAAKFPFRGASTLMDAVMIVAGAFLGYASWSTFREQK